MPNMIQKTLSDWLEYIYALHPRDIDLGLERISALGKSLSVTEFSIPVITVGGTNGKGSTVKFLESIYLASGYRVAAYTSPHLVRFNERLRINGEEISDETLLGAFEFVEKSRGDQSLSFFEFTTLAILYICHQIELDVLLLEVGLGGRLDAVNIIDPTVAVITTIDIDHTEWLGPDRESIAKEKAGIVRPGIPVICGDDNPPKSLVNAVNHNPFFCFKKDFAAQEKQNEWDWIGPDLKYLNLPLPHLKINNAATSLMVIQQLQSTLPVTQFGIITGIKNAVLPGRFEIRNNIIFDVAHNPQSMGYLAEQLGKVPVSGRTLAVIGMLEDKDMTNAVGKLIPLVDQWYVGDLDVRRGAKADQLITELNAQGVKNCYNFASVVEALKRAINEAKEQDRLLVAGSFYTVAMAKQYLMRPDNRSTRFPG